MRVADTVRRVYHLPPRRGEFYFDLVVNFEPKRVTPVTPNCNVLAKLIISYTGVS